jgi:hypothetical protein
LKTIKRLIAPAHLALACLFALAAGCRVAPPKSSFQGPVGLVRADNLESAELVSGYFEELQDQVDALLPGTNNRADEVWIQENPAMYTFNEEAYLEADGFWSESSKRIHLRRDSQSLRRTLAHELVHAALEGPWKTLPGTMEEGLCDVVSILLCPENATHMRTGRLSAAAFAMGGLNLEVELFLSGKDSALGMQIGTRTHVRLLADEESELQPDEVFSVAAGLSTTQLPINDKKALYGLSFLVVERIHERIGLTGLYKLCVRAETFGHETVPVEWLLEAADLGGATPEEWRAALRDAIGPAELDLLVQLYPALLSNLTAQFFGGDVLEATSGDSKGTIAACIRVSGADRQLDLSLNSMGAATPVESQYRRE